MILVDSIDCGMHAAFDLDLHCITDLVNFLMFRVNCDKSLSCWTLKRIEATVYNATGRNLPCSFILNLCIFYLANEQMIMMLISQGWQDFAGPRKKPSWQK